MQSRQHVLAVVVLCLGAAVQVAEAQTRWTGGILTDEAGVPLFISDAEPANTSQCYGACLGIWIPYWAPPDAKPVGEHALVKRTDGKVQWSFRGKPLYRWFNEKSPMDGQGMRGGNWHTVTQQ